jgi:EAL domain-containing protein (putative c-di-GMP-specific phosphodiesterase class I)
MMSYFTEILAKCRKHGIKACICGIEKKSQNELAKQLGFDYKQGYFYGKPEKLNVK